MPRKILMNSDEAECCQAGYPNAPQLTADYTIFNKTSKQCSIYGLNNIEVGFCGEGTNTIFSYYQKPPPYGYCECDRVFRAVGREDLVPTFRKIGGGRIYPAGGWWQSFPAAGECASD